MKPSTQKIEVRKPVRCLVIQLARLGDTIQSLMALRAAQQLYPNLEIHFLARERFAGAAQKIPWIKSVITLPTDALLSPVLSGEKTETEALRDLARWIAPVVGQAWDFAVNWSYSEASSYLTALIPARVKLGYTRRRDSSFAGTDGWSHYIQAIVQAGAHQNIHLTDILTTQLLTALQIHIGDPATEGNSPITSKTFFSSAPISKTKTTKDFMEKNILKRWIAVQIGAGQSEKTWSPQNWTKLIQYILDRNSELGVVLLGGKEDTERAEIISKTLLPLLKNSKSLISCVGDTSFDDWVSIISRSQWLIAGDTAAIHLASVLGTRVMNLSIGPVRYMETGPYGTGHYILRSEEELTPESAYAAWTYAANEWIHRKQISLESHFSQLGWADHLKNIQLYRSKIRATQEGGGVVYEPFIKTPIKLEEWSAMVMGHVARAWYCGWTPTIGLEIIREVIAAPLIQKLRELEEGVEVLSKICQQAKETARQLQARSEQLKSDKVMNLKDREEIRVLGAKLTDLEALMDRLGNTQPPFLTFCNMSKVMMHHLKGTSLAELGKETADSYQQLSEGVSIFKEWIQFTLNLAKPIALKPAEVKPIGKDVSL